MSILSAGDLTNLRTKTHRASPYLSVFKPVTLLTALVNNASITRGARTIAYDTGTGSGFSTIVAGQLLEIDTATGTKRLRVKSITGNQVSGTIETDENGVVWADNLVIRIKHFYDIYPEPPSIRSGIFYKLYDVSYTNQNSQPFPVPILGPHQAKFLSGGSATFSPTAANSYAIAQGATISTYSWACVHNGGGVGGITITNGATATPTITITQADSYWLSCTVTDSNGKAVIGRRVLFVHNRPGGASPPYVDFTIQTMTGDWESGGWKATVKVTGDVTLADFPDRTIVVLWYENFFNATEGYVNIWGSYGNNLLMCGYLRQDTDNDNFGDGTGDVSFSVTTVEDILNNTTPLGSVSLEAVSSPDVWYEYASWMTTGRSIHHLLFWHAWGVIHTADVFGLTSNTLGVQATDYSEAPLLQQVNSFSYSKGIFAKLLSNRLGQMRLVADSQMLNTAGRAALDTVCIITNSDISGTIGVVRQPEEVISFVDLNGFSFDGATATAYVSIIPGYRDTGISYIIPEERGGSTAQVGNQVLGSQTDANEKIGRYLALQNNNPRELRFSTPSNYIGAFDIDPSIGWYEWGITDVDLVRDTELNGKKFVCRHVEVRFGTDGAVFCDVVLEKEAIGPDGILGNYPTSYPATISPTPDWDEDTAVQTWGFVLAYANNTASEGHARIGSVGPLATGASYTFNATAPQYVSVCATSSTSGVICYRDSDTKGKAIAFTVSGTTIVYGSEITFNNAATQWTSCIALTSTSVLIAYRDSDTFGKVMILSISGTTITTNVEYVFDNTGAITGTSVARLSATKAIVSAGNGGTSEAFPLSISGTVITVGTGQGTAESGTYTTICSMDDQTAIMAYSAGSAPLRIIALTGITTTTFTYGTSIELNGDVLDTIPGVPFISKIDSSHAVLAYQQGSSPFRIKARAVSLSAGILSAGTEIFVSTAANAYDEFACIGVVKSDGSQAVIPFSDTSNGRVMSITIAGTTLTDNADEIIYSNNINSYIAMAVLKTVGS